MPVKEALAELNSLRLGEHFSYRALAKKHGCSRATLSRQHRGEVTPQDKAINSQRLLHPHDEAELVKYIRGLTKRHLTPTRQMIINFTAPLCAWPPSESWVTRFLNRHQDELINAWTTPMESSRHKADSAEKYKLYFQLLHLKIKEHEVLPENTYNMDEKGFMIGVIGRSKRVFDKVLFQERRVRHSSHDGNREWITIIAAICADGTHVPPGVIFSAQGNEVQASWVKEINPDKHSIHFATSSTGWTNDDLGVAWLKLVFDRYTKGKARRRWRLLILDGHGSHVTRAFIKYCDEHKILLLIFPPHATHTLQPLDVVCFKPLAQNYTNQLVEHHHITQGWFPVTKADFIGLFWPAWVNTFTESLVLTAFKTTGIHPPNADVILDRFKTPTPQPPATPPGQVGAQAASTEPNWLKTKSLLRSAVKDQDPAAANAVEQRFHHLHLLNELTQHEIHGLKEAVAAKKRKSKKKKVLPLSPNDPNLQGGAIFWSPSSKARADQRLAAVQQQQLEEEAAKTTRREIQHQKKLLRVKEQEDNRVRRLREKEERDQRRAKERAQIDARKAAREAQKRDRNAGEDIQLPNQGKRKASSQLQSKSTKRRGGGAARCPRIVHEPSPTPPPTYNSRGRKIAPPRRLR